MNDDQNYIVPFRVFDFSSPDEQLRSQGFGVGYYYEIPCDDDDRAIAGEIFIRGPYATAQEANQAAVDFIQDALTDYKENLS
jgi:hypothetical protein